MRNEASTSSPVQLVIALTSRTGIAGFIKRQPDEQTRADCLALVALMRQVTGEPAIFCFSFLFLAGNGAGGFSMDEVMQRGRMPKP